MSTHEAEKEAMPDMARLTWRRRIAEDAVREFHATFGPLRAHLYRRWQRLDWAIQGRLMAWATEECLAVAHDRSDAARLLGEDENGEWLVPAEPRDGQPYWHGRFRWHRPSHWPAYLRSRRARGFVMLENC